MKNENTVCQESTNNSAKVFHLKLSVHGLNCLWLLLIWQEGFRSWLQLTRFKHPQMDKLSQEISLSIVNAGDMYQHTVHKPCKIPLITQSAVSNYRKWSEGRIFLIQHLCSSSVCRADMHMSIILPPEIIYLGLCMSFCLSLRCHGLDGAESSSQDRCVRRSSRCRGIYTLWGYMIYIRSQQKVWDIVFNKENTFGHDSCHSNMENSE